jgi:hypothetical protein
MQVEPSWEECVAFICGYPNKSAQQRIKPGGTAFFVRIPDEADRDASWTYVVTARHCIEDSLKGPQGEFFLRIASVSDSKLGYKDVVTRWDQWFFHPEADVAVTLLITDEEPTLRIRRLPPTFIGRNFQFVPEVELYGESKVKAFKEQCPTGSMLVTLGHDLFFPGLFTQAEVAPVV